MKRVLIIAALSIQVFAQSQQTGTVIGHIVSRDSRGGPNPAGSDLRSLMNLIRGILEARPEYQQLPKPRGVYID